MPFTTPKTWATTNVLTATDLNTYVRDNIGWLASDKPSCRAKRTTTQSINNNTITPVVFDAEDWDTASMHSTSTNPSRITIPSGGGGKYHIGWAWYWATNVTGRRVSRLHKNGVFLLEVEMVINSGISSGSFSFPDSAVAGDYYEVNAFQSSGAALNIDAVAEPAYFWAYWYST